MSAKKKLSGLGEPGESNFNGNLEDLMKSVQDKTGGGDQSRLASTESVANKVPATKPAQTPTKSSPTEQPASPAAEEEDKLNVKIPLSVRKMMQTYQIAQQPKKVFDKALTIDALVEYLEKRGLKQSDFL